VSHPDLVIEQCKAGVVAGETVPTQLKQAG
jgi:hypothetical protein